MPFRTNNLCTALAEGAGICGALKVLWEVITMYYRHNHVLGVQIQATT